MPEDQQQRLLAERMTPPGQNDTLRFKTTGRRRTVKHTEPTKESEKAEEDQQQLQFKVGQKRELPLTKHPALQRDRRTDISKWVHADNAFVQSTVNQVGNVAKMASIVSTEVTNHVGRLFGIDDVADPKNDILYKWADRAGEWVEEAFPGNPELQGDFLVDTLPRAAANLAQQVALGGIYRPLAIVSASAFSSEEYERSLEATGDEEVAFQTFLRNLPVAGLSSYGAMSFLRRLDRGTGGGVKRILAKGFRGGVEEMTDEVASQWGTNLIAKDTYDETRKLTAGLKQGAGAGFALGFALNSIGLSLHHRANDPNLTPQERANVKEAQKMVDQELAETPEYKRGPLEDKSQQRQLERGKVVKNPKQTESEPGAMNQTNSAALTLPDKSSNEFARWFRKYWTPQGLFEKPIFKRLLKRDGAIERHSEKTRQIVRRLNTRVLETYAPDRTGLIGTIQNFFSPPDIDAKVIDTMDRTLKGKIKGRDLNPRVRETILEMRDHVDNLSRDMIKEGVIPESWAASAESNVGFYLHRTYRLHTDPKWVKQIPQDIRNRAEAFVKNFLETHSIVDGRKLKRKRKVAQEEVDRTINRVLHDELNPGLFFRHKALTHEASTDLSPLTKRQNIPQPIRALMGEVKDPVINYATSVQKMSQILENRRMLTHFKDKFDGIYFFKPGDRNAPVDASVRIAAEGNETLLPLDGMYTTKDIRDAFYRAYSPNRVSKAAQLWMRANAAPKYSKTVLNQVTHARNLLGGAEFVLRNGLIPNSADFRAGFEAAVGTFQNRGSKWEAERQELAELNIIRKGIRAGEMQDVSQDVNLNSSDMMSTSFSHIGKHASGFRRSASKFLKVATEAYQAEDDLLRVVFYNAELRRQRRADPNVSKEFVADLTRDMYQDYSQIPEGVKFLRRVPIAAPFVSFPYEVIRTNINTTKHGLREINSANPELRRIGYTRLASQAASLATTVAAGAATRAMLGMGVDEEDDVRRFMAPWDKRNTAAWVEADRGRYRYVNMSYTHPQQYLTDPILTFMGRGNEDELQDQMLEGFREMFAPVLGEELLYSALRDISGNEKGTGARVYNPEDDVGRRVADMFAHMWDAFEPGVLTSGGRIYESLYDDYSDKRVNDELIALFGFRVTRLNVDDSLPFKARDYRERVSDARSIYNSVKYEEGVTPQEELDAFRRANKRYREIFDEFAETVSAARRLGVPSTVIEEKLTENGISGDEFTRLTQRRFKGLEP